MSRRHAIALLCLGLALSCTAPAPEPEPSAEAEGILDQHERPIVEEDGKTLLWAGEEDDGTVHWFDMTDATVDPTRFQYGIGRDTIPSIDAPEFLAADDALLLARGVTPETPPHLRQGQAVPNGRGLPDESSPSIDSSQPSALTR